MLLFILKFNVPKLDSRAPYLNKKKKNKLGGDLLKNLLIDEYPLLVPPTLASQIGLNEAIALQQIHFWVSKSKNFKDGKYWVYNTYDGWQKQFPFWSVSTIRRVFKSLEEKKLIETANYNEMKYDQTKWYTINYDKLNKIVSDCSK